MIEEWAGSCLRLAQWVGAKLLDIVMSGESRFHWIYLLSFVATVAVVYVARRVSAAPSVGGFFSYLFPKDIYLARSARLDLELYFVNRIISPIRILMPFMSAAFVAAYVTSFLAAGLGASEPILPVTWWTIALFTAGMMAMSDLGSYLTHRLHHQIPMLWEFHKVHHSAEVLTPMTPFRMHPVYDIFDLVIRSALAGGLQGVFAYATAGEVSVYTVLGANVLLAVYYFCGSNVRHSHVWLSWGRTMERIFVSPAQHQVHHSCLPQHMNKNYGDFFALWDWMFGSLYVTGHAREELVIGVGGEQPHSSLWKAYSVPFRGVPSDLAIGRCCSARKLRTPNAAGGAGRRRQCQRQPIVGKQQSGLTSWPGSELEVFVLRADGGEDDAAVDSARNEAGRRAADQSSPLEGTERLPPAPCSGAARSQDPAIDPSQGALMRNGASDGRVRDRRWIGICTSCGNPMAAPAAKAVLRHQP